MTGRVLRTWLRFVGHLMGLELFNKVSRPRLFQKLSSEEFDLLIIGGGITGAAIFRDAALRGMKVALLEASDFASGTSGRSSKLIHGGLRYLKHFNFRLTWEACHERNLHLRLNKHLVRPQPFLMPLYLDSGVSAITFRLGMWLYEIMSGLKNRRFHRFLSREETLLMAPGLKEDGLRGGVLLHDAIVSDTRLTLETVKDAVRHGGIAINHAPVTGFLKNNDKISGVICCDQLSHGVYEARARVVVNAAGAWADRIRTLDKDDVSKLVRLSRGTHLVFDGADVPLTVSTVLFSPFDRRPLFLIKREGYFLFGTTDDWDEAEPEAPIPVNHDVEYLITSLKEYLPDSRIDRNKVRFIYSGFRTLPGSEAKSDPSSVTRDDLIEVSASGLITVIGGKLTTARIMAKRALKHVLRQSGNPGRWSPCRTHKVPIGSAGEEISEGPGQELLQVRSQLENACGSEMACTLEDLVERRFDSLHWSNEERLKHLHQFKDAICNELGINDPEFEEEYAAYRQYLKKFHALPP